MKPNVSKMLSTIRTNVSKHSPEILTGLGIAGMVTTTILAVKATPKALQLIEEAEYEKTMQMEKRPTHMEKLTPIETVKAAWKPYIPAAITGTLSIACLVGASSVNFRRNAALATAYKLSETALSEYKEKVVEVVGENKEKIIRDKVAEQKVADNPVSKNTVIVTEKGNTLCYDAFAGRYFRSDIDRIKSAVNIINRRMTYDQYVSLNEFYDELDLDHTQMGDQLGWSLDRGLVDVDFSSQIADDGTPCIVINYQVAPQRDFSKFL